MGELERCASILTHLNGSELRLERARNDVQIVETYTHLKTALWGLRKTSGVDGKSVEELIKQLEMEREKELCIEEAKPNGATGDHSDENDVHRASNLNASKLKLRWRRVLANKGKKHRLKG